MPGYLLDTNILSDLVHHPRRPPEVIRNWAPREAVVIAPSTGGSDESSAPHGPSASRRLSGPVLTTTVPEGHDYNGSLKGGLDGQYHRRMFVWARPLHP